MRIFNHLKYIICLIGIIHSGMLLSQQQNDTIFNPASETSKTSSLTDTIFSETMIIDSVDQELKDDSLHSPQKALLYSAVFPGLGQIYNKNWWKVPIVYAGFGVLGYYAYDHATNYVAYLQGYIDFRNEVPEENSAYKDLEGYYPGEEYQDLSLRNLEYGKDFYRKYRDLFYLYMVGWYFLNVIDANISAYFKQYDVSNDLSLQLKPAIVPSDYFIASGFGVSLQLKF